MVAPDAIASQFQMACYEISVQVREKNVRDFQGMFGGKGKVLVDVALQGSTTTAAPVCSSPTM